MGRSTRRARRPSSRPSTRPWTAPTRAASASWTVRTAPRCARCAPWPPRSGRLSTPRWPASWPGTPPRTARRPPPRPFCRSSPSPLQRSPTGLSAGRPSSTPSTSRTRWSLVSRRGAPGSRGSAGSGGRTRSPRSPRARWWWTALPASGSWTRGSWPCTGSVHAGRRRTSRRLAARQCRQCHG